MYALTAKGMRFIDKHTMSLGVPSPVLMENASKAVVDLICSRFPERKTRILVLCGSGNNGGDAVCVARWLTHLGYHTVLYFAGNPDRTSEEFLRQMNIFTKTFPDAFIGGLEGDERDADALEASYDVIVDGLFGTGLDRRLGFNYIRFIEYINSRKAYKIAIDIPSGLNATTGQNMDALFMADETVTFGSYKIGMLMGDGRACCGKVTVADIGLASSGYDLVEDKLIVCDNKYFSQNADRALVPRLEKSHKGTFGTVGILVGQGSMMGASMLAARAAYRAGCGLVKILCPRKFMGYFNISIPEAVVIPYRSEEAQEMAEKFLKEIGVAVVGPGLAENQYGRQILDVVFSNSTPAVIDAGALNLISRNSKSFRKRRCQCVITPHIGELARLCGEDIGVVEKNIIGFVKRFSHKHGVSMVAKNDVSIVSLIDGDGQQLYINTIGNSGLATAGSGDVLTGTVASLAAQGNSLNTSLLYGVMLHGRAAERFARTKNGERKMMAGDIADNIF